VFLAFGWRTRYECGMKSLMRGLAVLGLMLGVILGATAGVALAQEEDPTAVTMEQPADSQPPVEEAPADNPDAGAIEQPTATPTPTPTVTPTPSPTLTPTPTATPTPPPSVMVQQTIQRNLDQQVQAIATRNLSILSDTTTDDYFRLLVGQFRGMLDTNKINAITLLQIEWGPISVSSDGTTAKATTTETWQIVSEAGSVDYAPARNDYGLVQQNGTWRITSDAIAVIPT
jgi:hypothetical protein